MEYEPTYIRTYGTIDRQLPFSTLAWSFAQAHPNELHIPYSIVIVRPESSSEPGITLYVRL